MAHPMNSKLKVAVIGAGAAGLCAAKHLSLQQKDFKFCIFEQQGIVGGTWKYTQTIGLDENGLPVHSSMYENLRTNLPKEAMAFPDFQFPDCNGRSFIHHSEVLKYLEDYAEFYNLYQYIKFYTFVKIVKPIDTSKSDPKWTVVTKNLKTDEETRETYDAVMVCNGHYSVPYIPKLPGVERFKGTLIHSHNYRNNSAFKDNKVVVLGAGASGIDIAIELTSAANEVILSHNLPVRTTPLPENLFQEVGIESITENGVKFLNGREYNCDAILLCTGYLYTYPFLGDSCNIKIGDQRVQPLYKHLFHIDYPTLGIWAVPKQILPFPIYDQQVKVFLKFLKGEVSLPSRKEMIADEENDFKTRLATGMTERNAHTMRGQMQWDYDIAISAIGGIPPLPNVVRDMFMRVHTLRKEDVLNYKEHNFQIVDSEKFIETNGRI